MDNEPINTNDITFISLGKFLQLKKFVYVKRIEEKKKFNVLLYCNNRNYCILYVYINVVTGVHFYERLFKRK